MTGPLAVAWARVKSEAVALTTNVPPAGGNRWVTPDGAWTAGLPSPKLHRRFVKGIAPPETETVKATVVPCWETCTILKARFWTDSGNGAAGRGAATGAAVMGVPTGGMITKIDAVACWFSASVSVTVARYEAPIGLGG